MLKAPTDFIIIFILISVLLIIGMAVFISIIIYKYQQRQHNYLKDIETLKASHEISLLQSQLEIQEQTIQNISREIHDNISQKLTLAKLHLNTIEIDAKNSFIQQLKESILIIGDVINDLTDLSRSMSSEIILNHGLIKAIDYEISQFSKTGIYKIKLLTSGNPVFLNAETELLLFRIIQEVLNNIVKHSNANLIDISLNYSDLFLIMEIKDDGKGFDISNTKPGIGLHNIKKRTTLLHGTVSVNSCTKSGTHIKIKIPIYDNN